VELDVLKVMTHSYALATLVEESISSNLLSQRNKQGQWEEVNQRLLDHWYVISGQLLSMAKSPEFLGGLRNRCHRLIAR